MIWTHHHSSTLQFESHGHKRNKDKMNFYGFVVLASVQTLHSVAHLHVISYGERPSLHKLRAPSVDSSGWCHVTSTGWGSLLGMNMNKPTPPKTNRWKLRIPPWKRRNIYKATILRLHLVFAGVYETTSLPIQPTKALQKQTSPRSTTHSAEYNATWLETRRSNFEQTKNTHVWGSHHGFLGNLQLNTSKWICKSSGANFSFDWWLCHSWNDAIPQLWKKTVRFEISHKTEGLKFEVICCFSLSCCLILFSGLSFFSGLPDGSSSHTSWPWAAKPVLHYHDKIHRHQTTSPSPGGSPGPGSGMPPVKSSTSPEATSGRPATNIPAKPAK